MVVTVGTSSFDGRIFIRPSGEIDCGLLVGGGDGNGDVWGSSEISCSLTMVASFIDAAINGWARRMKGSAAVL